jgi:hypothetical protein
MSRTRPVPLLALCTVLLAAPAVVGAQQEEPPPPEKVEARRVAAEGAPLFAAQEPLALTLRTDIKRLRDERPDSAEVDGTVTFVGHDGTPASVPVKVRTRGNFRRNKANCNFPPLRLNFAGKSAKGTVFEGQDKLKLVTPCQDSREEYQQYVLQEYLVYRVYELLTPASFRVRLLHITYEDVDGGYNTRTKTAFLIEDDKAMAARSSAEVFPWERLDPTGPQDTRAAVRALSLSDDQQGGLVALFQFMIGNTDFSAPFFHNVETIKAQDGRYLWVPYDFDFSGIVDARYATPDPQLNLPNVRQRIFRGFCRRGVDHAGLIARFNAIRDSIPPLYQGMEEMQAGQRERALKYYDKFYELVNDPKAYDRAVVKACRRTSG